MENETTINTTQPTVQMAGSKSDGVAQITNTATTVFADEHEGTVLNMPDATQDISTMDHIGATDINEFFARPVRIYADTWANAAAGATILPWLGYLNNASVINKIRNFAYLRSKLHIKVVVNSSPFYYGALQLAYYPYNLDQSSVHFGINGFSKVTKVPTGLRPYLQSTLPHIVLEAAKSKGGEMVIPFIYDRNYLDLRTSTGVGRMGTLSFQELAPLVSASAGTASAYITVYAWMEDVVLTGATNQTVLQSDAYGDGPISKPASVIAAIAGKLTSAPIIGPYARATTIAASAVGKIASMFGYSNVPLIEPIHHVRNTGIGNCASSEIGSHIEKLSLDPKNELSIDPRIVGAEQDDMQIDRLVTREGIVSISSWIISSPVDTQIWSSKVNPNFTVQALASGTTCSYLPPISHVSHCFAFWRGDIVFRFKIIKSKYHKGRLRVSWDTVGQPSRTAADFVTSLTAIWDIADTDEFEFKVPYQNETAFLPTYPSMSPDNVDTTVNGTNTDNPYSNGILTITVVNSLTAPIDVAPATIIAYARAGAEWELAGPKMPLANTTESLNYSFLEPQSDTITVGFKNDNYENNLYAVHFGEVIKSIKVLMYRTNLLYTMGGNATAGWRSQISRPRLPPFYGYDKFGISTAKTQTTNVTTTFNWVRTTPYHWFTPAFVFQRGSHNYRLYIRDTDHDITVTRVPYLGQLAQTTNDYRPASTVNFDTTGRGLIIDNPQTQPAGAGTTVAISEVNPTIEFSLPLYSRYRAITNAPDHVNLPPYAWLSNSNTVGGFNTTEENARGGHNLEGWVASAYSTTVDLKHDLFHSVGIDFSLYFYRGCPALYLMTTPGAA